MKTAALLVVDVCCRRVVFARCVAGHWSVQQLDVGFTLSACWHCHSSLMSPFVRNVLTLVWLCLVKKDWWILTTVCGSRCVLS